MKIQNITWVLFLCLLFSLITLHSVNAGYVPGTIGISWWGGSWNCGYKNHEYDPYNGWCEEDSCNIYNTGSSVAVCGCKEYEQSCTWTWASVVCTDTTTCAIANDCKDSSFGCEEYNTIPETWKATFFDRISTKDFQEIQDILTDEKYITSPQTEEEKIKEQVLRIKLKWCDVWKDQNGEDDFTKITCWGWGWDTYQPPVWMVSLDVGKSCHVSCEWTTHIPPLENGGSVTCTDGKKVDYYTGGEHGTCSCTYYDNMIDSITQLGWVNTSWWSGVWSSCSLEWRYAIPDNTGPIINVINYGTLWTDDQMWCNLNKFNPDRPENQSRDDKFVW